MTEQEYKAFFGLSVEIDKLINNVLKPILGKFVVNPASATNYASKDDYRLLAESANIHSIFHKGNFSVGPADNVAVFEVVLKDECNITRARKDIQKIVRKLIGIEIVGAFIIFHHGSLDKETWRFSWVEKTGTEAAATSAKRYTYLCGPSYSCRTIAERFVKLEEKVKEPTFDSSDITAAFDVEALSDEFFYNFRALYSKIQSEGEKGKSKYKRYKKLSDIPENELGFCDFIERYKEDNKYFASDFAKWDSKVLRDYIKKMMGRLVFLQFLQKKGWMCGNPNYLKSLFEKFVQGKREEVTDIAYGSFLDEVLEPLFFGVLNTKAKDREKLFKNEKWNLDLLNEWKDIPYLNGGLFEQEVYDKPKSAFPNVLFNELFTLFSEYNFTIDENDPDDKEVGIDPEMLSKIFESQLEDNKDKGAFYTPKEIVEYMCKESLIAYLQTDITDESQKENIRSFVCDSEAALQDGLRLSIAEKLKNVKICDPAIGSGAFPMGMLNLLMSTREKIESVQNRLELKKEIICNNLYGVDIEKGAVDIARLRFWLSLVIDEEKPAALPNLDYKIMQGNSLLEQYEGVDLSGMSLNEQAKSKAKKGQSWQQTLVFDEQGAFDNIQNAIRESFATEDHNKKSELREIINENIKNYIYNLKGCTPEIQQKLTVLPIPNDQFFLWHIYFKEVFNKGGFDIVIGNPPFGATLSEEDKIIYRSLFPEVQFKINTYTLFILQACKLMRDNGMMYYIIPNTMLDNYFEENVRKKLCTLTLHEINDLNDKVFESAVVHSMIFAFKNRSKKEDYDVKVNISDKLNTDFFFIPCSFFEEEPQCTFSIHSYDSNDLLKKLKEGSKKLFDVLDIRQAIKTGNDKRYITNSKLADNFKPILRGKDIKRYTMVDPMLFVDYGKHLACSRDANIFEQPKILIREAGATITATYDDNNYYIMSSLYNAILKDENFSLKYLLALICSKLYQQLMNKLTFEKTQGAFTKAKIFHYYELPVKDISLDLQRPFITLVDRILSAKKENPQADTSVDEALIDILVYLLYNLTFEEVQIVDPSFAVEEYGKWLANYQQSGTLPTEAEMRTALGC